MKQPIQTRSTHQFMVQADRGSYEVTFGSLKEFPIDDTNTALVIADENVASLHASVQQRLERHANLVMAAHEENKSLDFVTSTLLPWLLENGASRTRPVVVIGGGIVQDAVSFACSIYRRGIPWIGIPTTLLAQADSCIGSKTSINYDQSKNLLGTYYSAQRVLIDVDFLGTLSDSDYLSGVGEIIKVCLLKGAEEKDWLQLHMQDLLTKHPQVVHEAIWRALHIKKDYIEVDEYDVKSRNELNYGHDFGHAIESASNFSISHGLAVMYGMEAANNLSVSLGYLPLHEAEAMNQLIRPYLRQKHEVRELSWLDLLPHLKKDKKSDAGELTFILSRGCGEMFKQKAVVSHPAEQVWEQYRTSLSE